jgi:hypothetical protein
MIAATYGYNKNLSFSKYGEILLSSINNSDPVVALNENVFLPGHGLHSVAAGSLTPPGFAPMLQTQEKTF